MTGRRGRGAGGNRGRGCGRGRQAEAEGAPPDAAVAATGTGTPPPGLQPSGNEGLQPTVAGLQPGRVSEPPLGLTKKELQLQTEAMFPTYVVQALGRVSPALDQIIERYENNNAPVEAFESMVEVLKPEPALCWVTTIDATCVGVNPSNRGGIGLVVTKSFEVSSKHLRSGYSYAKACEGAYAESAPVHPESIKDVTNFNDETSQVQPELPPLASLTVTSLGNGHTNGFLRLAKGKAPCPLEDLAPTGRLDPEVLSQNRPGLKTALAKGLLWTVVHTGIFNRYPVLRDVSITALNNKSHQEVGELEGMLMMSRKSDSQILKGQKPDYAQCLSAGLLTEPFWAPWASCILDVVKLTPTEAILHLAGAVTALSPAAESQAMHHLGHQFMSKLAAFKTPGLVQPVRVRIAAMLANMLSPPDAVDSGRYSLITPTDIGHLGSKKLLPAVLTAEQVLDKARDLCKEHNVTPVQQHRLLGTIDYRVVCFLLRKGSKSIDRKDFVSLYDICTVCVGKQ